MSVSLQVDIKVSSLDDQGNPVDPPLYESKLTITADCSCPIKMTVPAKKTLGVAVCAGIKDWLRLLAISPDFKGAPPAPPPKNFSFVCADDNNNQTGPFDLSKGAVAYWGDGLTPLFDGLSELKWINFNNPSPCPIDVSIFVAKDVAAKQVPADVCPPAA
jgi:hypothetical protein